MSLIDSDPNSDLRTTPTVNQADGVRDRMAHNTYGNTHRRAGGSVTPRMRFMNGLIVTYDSSNNVSSVYGYIPEVSTVPVLIIAKSGNDVFTDLLSITAPVT